MGPVSARLVLRSIVDSLKKIGSEDMQSARSAGSGRCPQHSLAYQAIISCADGKGRHEDRRAGLSSERVKTATGDVAERARKEGLEFVGRSSFPVAMFCR